jgi:hypothetical protein
MFVFISFFASGQCTVGMPIAIATDLTCPTQPNGNVGPVPASGISYINAPGTYTVFFGNSASKLFVCTTGVIISYFGGTGNTIIENGAAVNITDYSSNQQITNYGLMTFPGMSLGMGSSLYNDVTGVINFSGQSLNVNAMIYNKGILTNIGQYSTGVGGYLCMGDQSIIRATSIFNNVVNTFTTDSPSSKGCFSFSSTFNANGILSATSNVGFCAGPSSTDVSSPTYYGSAIKYTNCSGCITALPITDILLEIKPSDNSNLLQWQSFGLSRIKNFKVQKSFEGVDFTTIGTSPYTNNTDINNWTDSEQLNGKSYYRVVAIDYSGKEYYSNIVFGQGDNTKLSFQIFPNPTNGRSILNVISGSSSSLNMEILDSKGLVCFQKNYTNFNNLAIIDLDLSQFPAAAYIVQVTSDVGIARKVIVKN